MRDSSPKLRKASLRTVELAPWLAGRPSPEDLLEGSAEMGIAVLWRSQDGRSANGLFRAEPSRIRVLHPVDQTLVVLSGAAYYTEEEREPLLLEAGEALVITEGARYVVEVIRTAEMFWTMTSRSGPIEFLDRSQSTHRQEER